MTSSILITKNLNLLYLSVQALDLYTMDKIDHYGSMLDLIDLFNNRQNSLLKYSSHFSTYDMKTTLSFASKLFNVASTAHCQRQIKLILQDISKENVKYNEYSPLTQKYIARFHVAYCSSVEPYLVGKEYYINQIWLKKLSFLNLFLLNKLCKPQGLYILLMYIYKNTFN